MPLWGKNSIPLDTADFSQGNPRERVEQRVTCTREGKVEEKLHFGLFHLITL